MVTFSRYSMLVFESVDEIIPIFDKYGVTMEPSDFAPGAGYIFDVQESIIGESGLVRELCKKNNVIALSFAYQVEKYISPDGTQYESYEAYCNDPDLDTDLVQVKLYKGERTPQNQFERDLLKEIEEARKNGKSLEIYPE